MRPEVTFTVAIASALAAATALTAVVTAAEPVAPGAFSLSSPDVTAGAQVPEKFVSNTDGCTGVNVSPQLKWSGVPAGTKSFAVTLFDEDEHSTPSGWWHWVIYDIPRSATELPQGAGGERAAALPRGALEGRNDDGDEGYTGPCPDAGDPPHRYVFTVYALKTDKLPVKPGASGAMVTWTVHDYTLAKATLTVRHRNVASPVPKH